MLPQWRVTYGPEFEQSRRAVSASSVRLKQHLDAIELALTRNPFESSEQFGEEHQRVISTDDFADGFILTAFVVLHRNPSYVAEIKWIVMRELPDADDDEGGES